MIKDERLKRVLAAEVGWAEAVSRVDEMSVALVSALGEALSDPPREDEIQAELAKLNDFVHSALSRVNELTQELLNSIGDDAQLANVDLQNVLQKQQQTLQMMSNISKILYDTAQSVIRKFGG
jgi:hypothetical protein